MRYESLPEKEEIKLTKEDCKMLVGDDNIIWNSILDSAPLHVFKSAGDIRNDESDNVCYSTIKVESRSAFLSQEQVVDHEPSCEISGELYESGSSVSGFSVSEPSAVYIKNDDIENIDRIDLEGKTRGQTSNELWMKARKGRITASIAGEIYRMRASTNPSSLLNRINQLDRRDISNITAIRHGRETEPEARDKYEKLFNVSVEERGLMLHPEKAWLSASVDGFVTTTPPKVLEIKCPLLSSKDPVNATLTDLARARKGFFLCLKGNELSINRSHKYFYQCQIQMACMCVEECDFFVYLKKARVM